MEGKTSQTENASSTELESGNARGAFLQNQAPVVDKLSAAEGPSYGSRRYGSAFFGPNENLAIFLGIVPLNFRENQGKDTMCKMLKLQA